MFVVSRLLSAITQPMFWLALLWLLALAILPHWRKAATVMLWCGLAILGVLGFEAVPDALLRPLEDQYAAPDDPQLRQHVGVVVLGGAMGPPYVFQHHQQAPMESAGERMTVPMALLRQQPTLELVFSGGEGRLLPTGITEADLARAFYAEQGADMRRVTFEPKARTTRENAQQVAKLLGSRCSEKWLLVTSAWHMPRAMAEFEAAGCPMTPYPVDFRTGARTPWSEYSLAKSLLTWQTALHEWLGLLAYRLTR